MKILNRKPNELQDVKLKLQLKFLVNMTNKGHYCTFKFCNRYIYSRVMLVF
jgi:hypothetical protein